MNLVAAVLSLSISVPTVMEARNGADVVRVYDSPCVSAQTLAMIQEQDREKFRKAQGQFNGSLFFGCWIPGGDRIYLIWEDGDMGIIPAADLKPVSEI